jgi:hypothetical protein
VFSDADDLERDDPPAFAPGKILSLPSRATPEWLVGPADGLGAAADPCGEATDEAPPETLPQPVLRRPGAPAPVPGIVAKPAPEVAVTGTEKAEKSEPVAEPARPRRAAPPGIWAPVASSVPSLRLVLPAEPEPVEDGPAPAPPTSFRGLPGRDSQDLPRVVAVQPPLAALQEPWWVIAIDGLRTSRRAQLGVAVALAALILVAYWSWPRGVGTTSLSELRRYPSRFDGRAVVVRGRVGDDVFAVGAGWAFYLVQGRDTIVTFTRTQMPKPHDVATVRGQVSTGFLDGVPRQALFEDSSRAQ